MTLTKWKTYAALALAAVPLALVPSVSLGETSRIKATDSREWSPDFKHIRPGDKMVWRNPTSRTHTVTAYGGWSKSNRLQPGERTSKVFRSEGVYKFRCKIHSSLSNGDCNGMCGVVHVEDY